MQGLVPLRSLFLVMSIGLAPAIAVGQEPRPATLDAGAIAVSGGIELTYAWRFHPGDDARWADPAFDDAGWAPVAPGMSPGELPRAGWPGVGWFRRHLLLGPGPWGSPLVMRLDEVGVADVYLDGALVGRAGAFAPGAAPEVAPSRHGPWPITFSGGAEHVLAVRYSCAPVAASQPGGRPIGFTISIQEEESLAAARVALARRINALLGSLVAILVFVALLHLALYSFYPPMRENLFYALYMAVFAFIVFRDVASGAIPQPAWVGPLNRWGSPAPVVAVLLGFLTYLAVRTRPLARSWRAFAVVALVFVPAVYFAPEPYSTWLWFGYFVATAAEVVRIEATGRTVAREGSRILAVGGAVLAACIVLQVLVNFRIVPAVAGFRAVYVFGVLASVTTLSLFLARSFARTSLHLERRLAEVQMLSERLLEQERGAHEAELRARVLAAENERKTRELEEGRALQLSMLPAGLPDVAGLEVAVAMATATEVGGDYYDFRAGPDGALVVGVGDATGHGLAAGVMVTAVKALFATLAGERGLAQMLEECDRVLHGMNLKTLHMCLTAARFTARSVTVCSAGMPSALLWRAAGGTVEELGAGGLPLGSGLAPTYEEAAAALAPGDTVLFTTDGFPELLDPAGEPLGFEAAAESLLRAGGASAQGVVDCLLETVASWRGERESADDVTFVVVRVRE
jgi:serine phosphatase RsbU (regulator of sigma subunit)